MFIRYILKSLINICLLLLFVSTIAEDDSRATEDRANLRLQKSLPYTKSNEAINSRANLEKRNSLQTEDSVASPSEYRSAKYFAPSSRNCYDCNKEPWIPIVGRSLRLSPETGHSSNFVAQPRFREKVFAQPMAGPPLDHYGAPRGRFNFPFSGEVVDFMLPPPLINYHNNNNNNKPLFLNRPPLVRVPNFRQPPFTKYAAPTTHLRPVSQHFQPPLPSGGNGLHVLPLENNLPPAMPSDSYGRPLKSSLGYLDPVPSASGESVDYYWKNDDDDGNKNVVGLFKHGLTDVQVLPSVRIADYTASIEHPINLIQSPILDLNVVKDSSQDTLEKLSENPIVVKEDDSFTSASNINTTFSDKRTNDKYLADSSEATETVTTPKDNDLTQVLIHKLLLEHKIIPDPRNQVINVKKSVINPPQTMVPPKQQSKRLQIVVPYLKPPASNNYQQNAIYNKEYTTLAPVFVPPPVTNENDNLWTQLMQEIQEVDTHKEPARGFIKSTTEVYNIKEFLANYDAISLQKNIDDWTHQSYADRHNLGLTTKLAHVKNIPHSYFDGSTKDNLEASGSDKKEYVNIEDNLVVPDKEEFITSTAAPRSSTATSVLPTVSFVERQPKTPSWRSLDKVTISNSTHEKVYVVTPQNYVQSQTSTPATAFSMAPRIQNGQINNATSMTRISVKIEGPSAGENLKLKPVKVVYSEWPHIINDLATTTTTLKPTTRHPLFGLMDLAPFTRLPNVPVATITGHSKVSTMGTSPFSKHFSTTPMPNLDSDATVKISAL